ncbi:MAG: prolyl oligopeptidase family serine peptidase [Polyangiaceae bacterium]
MKRAVALAAMLACGCGTSSSAKGTGGASVDSGAANGTDAGIVTDDASGAPLGEDAGDETATLPDGAASRCTTTSTTITCEHEVLTLDDAGSSRPVTYATPLGTPPASGWPAVVFFQGSLVPGDTAFAATTSSAFGEYYLTLTIQALLDDGYAVIAPDAADNGTTFWETNIPPYATSWTGSPDDVYMLELFAAISAGQFGPIDDGHLYAMGISSGGFMTSRMAVSYAGRFRALADHSGSYATCSDTCTVPTPLPSNHPPTLFLHGDTDDVVPITAIQPYIDALNTEGFETQLVTDTTAGHQWLSEAVQAIPAWFATHP